MKIFEFRDFPNPRRVRVFLAEKGINGIPFAQIDVPGGEHRKPAFLARNPYGSVPTLELDDGTFISETVAICRYFEARHPEPHLMGETPEETAAIEMWQRRIEHTLFDTIATYFHHATPGLGGLEAYQNKEWGAHNRDLFLAAMEKTDTLLAEREFIAGDRFSIADITALCAIDYGGFVEIGIPAELTNLQRWYDAVSSRPGAGA
jgi:glutathione S-transferase